MRYLHLLGNRMPIVERNNHFDVRYLVEVNALPYIIADKQQFGIGVIDDMYGIGSLEVLQDRHNYGAIGNRSQEGGYPAGVVSAHEGDFVFFLQTIFFEHDMQMCNHGCQLTISQRFICPPIGNSGQIPMLAKRGLETFDQVVSFVG